MMCFWVFFMCFGMFLCVFGCFWVFVVFLGKSMNWLIQADLYQKYVHVHLTLYQLLNNATVVTRGARIG
jgi:hypothetical protein